MAASFSGVILICLLAWLRNPLLKLIDIYRKDKITTEIIAIDRKSHFDDSNSSLSGDGDGKRPFSVDCGENTSVEGLTVMESAEKKLRFDL